MHIDIKKAVTPAAVKTMKKMSMKGFERTAAVGQSQVQGQRGTKRAAEDLSSTLVGRKSQKFEGSGDTIMDSVMSYAMGNIGRTLDRTLLDEGLAFSEEQDADLDQHLVQTERRHFYRPSDVPKPKSKEGEIQEEQVEAGEDQWKEASDATLTEAYHYGGSLVAATDMGDGKGTLAGLKTGMEITGFMKMSDVSVPVCLSLLDFRTDPFSLSLRTDSLRLETGRRVLRLRKRRSDGI
jgi:hypothetical protein